MNRKMNGKQNSILKARKTVLIALLFVSVFFILGTAAGAEIKTVSDFKNMGNAGTYTLANDLVIDAETWDSLSLTGITLDGSGRFITLTSDSSSEFEGIFKELDSSSVSNLVINVAADLQFSGTSGILAAAAIDSNIDNCHVNIYETVTVTGSGASTFGGLVGNFDGSGGEAVSSSSVSIFSPFEGIDNTGGLIGTLTNGTVTQSYVFGDVSATGDVAGGLIGLMKDGTVEESYASGAVSGGDNVGGLIGLTEDGDVKNSYSVSYAGSVLTGSGNVGGLIGKMSDGSVDYCYSVQTCQELVGQKDGGTVSDSYFVETTTDSGMRDYNTFSGWSIENGAATGTKTWFIYDSFTYPQLAWQKQLTYDIYVDSADHLEKIGRDWGTFSDAKGKTVRGFANARYIQADDIEFTGTIEDTGVTHPYFNGMYDGNGYQIKNLTIEYSGTNVYTGFFPCVVDGVFQNINLVNADVSSNGGHDGILIGRIFDGSSNSAATQIINCSVDGQLRGTNYSGSFVGNHTNGTLSIANSVSSADVSGGSYVGGLAGFSSGPSTLVYNSSSSGSVQALGENASGLLGGVGLSSGDASLHCLTVLDSSSSGQIEASQNAGGLIGYIHFRSNVGIYNSNHTTGLVAMTGSGTFADSVIGELMDSGAGGLVGNIRSDTLIQNSYATGTVKSADFGAGGLVGCRIEGALTIEDSYFEGEVEASTDAAGGLIGTTNSGNIVGSKASGVVTAGGSSAGGLLGHTYSSVNITKSSFAGTVIADGNNAGGLVGFVQKTGNILESTASANVKASSNVGGLVGVFNSGNLLDSYANGRVVADNDSGVSAAGGVIGYLPAANSDLTVERVYSTNEVTGTGSAVGGLLSLVGDGSSVKTVTLKDSFAFNNYVEGAAAGETGRVFGTADSTVNFVLDNIQVLDSIQGNSDLSKETADISEIEDADVLFTFNDGGNIGSVWEPFSTNSWKSDSSAQYGFPILVWQDAPLGMWQPWPPEGTIDKNTGGSKYGQAYVVNAAGSGSSSGTDSSESTGSENAEPNTPIQSYSNDLPENTTAFPYWILILGFIVLAGVVLFVVGRRYMN
ncbi:hypothetical protein MmiAt1_15430 [Methanimicrococcus sp. At1]|uniref:GLUG domain-containing protein n=1 Tax=Methanimicrococcus hacksteinii TaxID=3028293 RepID=A0ABU3VRA3_9EURY|nr:hypothetical protein [Methanimicrococcus sp. At1]MDV0445939.1 hypothetical protein [Methanimicrococcus sp. At1]